MKTCPNCYQKQENDVLTCDCGYDFSSSKNKVNVSKTVANSKNTKEELIDKYPSLRTISQYFTLLAIINLILSIIIAVTIFKNQSVVLSVVPVIWGLIVYVINSAIAELITVAIDIEKNQRKLIQVTSKKLN
jgi:uncharacterized membrane protein YvbJ